MDFSIIIDRQDRILRILICSVSNEIEFMDKRNFIRSLFVLNVGGKLFNSFDYIEFTAVGLCTQTNN